MIQKKITPGPSELQTSPFATSSRKDTSGTSCFYCTFVFSLKEMKGLSMTVISVVKGYRLVTKVSTGINAYPSDMKGAYWTFIKLQRDVGELLYHRGFQF